jgi:hypothetical protein
MLESDYNCIAERDNIMADAVVVVAVQSKPPMLHATQRHRFADQA